MKCELYQSCYSNNMMNTAWEEIHGFASMGEYYRFVEFIEKQIDSGDVVKIEAVPDYGAGEIYGGRWFKNQDTNEIWRLVSPDMPFKGLWEPVIERRGVD